MPKNKEERQEKADNFIQVQDRYLNDPAFNTLVNQIFNSFSTMPQDFTIKELREAFGLAMLKYKMYLRVQQKAG